MYLKIEGVKIKEDLVKYSSVTKKILLLNFTFFLIKLQKE